MSDDIPIEKMCEHGEYKGHCNHCDEIKQLKRVQKLATALKELEGFAKRNAERAKKAWQEVQSRRSAPDQPWKDITDFYDDLKAEARWHEAERFYQVVHMRVDEALS